MHEVVTVALSDLLLDSGNARLGEAQNSQQAVITALAKQGRKWLVKLAEDIVGNGLDPTTLPAVVATNDRRKRYKVVEGNRRVLTLKALETPSIVSGILSDSDQRRLVELASKFSTSPINDVECVLFENEAEAWHWVELRHTGSNEGIGLVEWDSNEKDRFKARHGGATKRTTAGQVLDFLENVDPTSSSGNKRILTNIQRLVNDKDVRMALGLEVVDGDLASVYPGAEVAKGLSKIVNDLKDGTVKVRDIYHKEDRADYLKSFSARDLPNTRTKLADPVALDNLATGDLKPIRKAKRQVRVKPQQSRTTVIPASCALNIGPPRINAIYVELLNLNVEQYPNACGVLLRVFLELSVDHEIDKASLMTEADRKSAPLGKRLKTVADHLVSTKQINSQLAKAIQSVASRQNMLAASTVTFNQYVHNSYVYPKPSEIRTYWDELQPFMEQLWL